VQPKSEDVIDITLDYNTPILALLDELGLHRKRVYDDESAIRELVAAKWEGA
jgi:hypothetical protein